MLDDMRSIVLSDDRRDNYGAITSFVLVLCQTGLDRLAVSMKSANCPSPNRRQSAEHDHTSLTKILQDGRQRG